VLLGLLLLGLSRSGFDNRGRLYRFGVGFVGLLVLVLHS
jgi:hypothetical protein